MDQMSENDGLRKPDGQQPNWLARHKRTLTRSLLIVVCVAILALAAFFFYHGKNGGNSGNISMNTPSVLASEFAPYKETPVSFKANVPAYSTDSELSNILNREDFLSDNGLHAKLTDQQKSLLVKNLFVVSQTGDLEFFKRYEQNRYMNIPNFVTTDSILHNYHLVFDDLLKNLEEQKLIQSLNDLNKQMLQISIQQYKTVKGTSWENAAKRNVGFVTVAAKLIDPNASVPSEAPAAEVQEELGFIQAHQGIHSSPLINMGQNLSPVDQYMEDYSQYVPRGHYTKSEELKKYFNAMMWYGRMTFRFKSDDETKSAALLTTALNTGDSAKSWDQIYEPTAFFVGKSDDIGYFQFKDIIKDIYGGSDLKTVASDTAKFASLKEAAGKLEAPKINSVPIFDKSIQPDKEAAIKGFRFMGQRFTMDAQIFSQLVYRSVDTNVNDLSQRRMLPKGLDITAAMGSSEALNLLQLQGDTKHQNYQQNLDQLKTYLGNLDTKTWTQNLYWGWLYSIKPLSNEGYGSGYPSFMANVPWQDKELNTYLGSWTELKHDTILYSKQSYAELGGGGDIPARDDRGYVEPNPYLYARLASLLGMTKEGLQIRGILTNKAADNLGKMQELAVSLKTISEKELNNQDLTDAEYDLIRSYGGQLEHFWYEVNQEEMDAAGENQTDYLNQNPAAIVADVATDPNGAVLEEGTGGLNEILAIVPVAGKLKIASGLVYSHYEFPWPLNDRLTDEAWREMVKTGQRLPDLPDWTKSFTVSR